MKKSCGLSCLLPATIQYKYVYHNIVAGERQSTRFYLKVGIHVAKQEVVNVQYNR